MKCSECGRPLFAFEEWELRPGAAVGLPVLEGDYRHAMCPGEER